MGFGILYVYYALFATIWIDVHICRMWIIRIIFKVFKFQRRRGRQFWVVHGWVWWWMMKWTASRITTHSRPQWCYKYRIPAQSLYFRIDTCIFRVGGGITHPHEKPFSNWAPRGHRRIHIQRDVKYTTALM